jgi:hypothetical protein
MLPASLAAVGVACSGLMAVTGVLFVLELAFAHRSSSPSPLPPPTDRRVLGVLGAAAFAAFVVGFLAARRYLRREREADFQRLLSLAPVATVLIIALLFVVGNRINERNYLSAASRYFPTASETVLKDDGHQACDWLRGRHWGPPPPLSANRGRAQKFWSSLMRGKYAAPYPVSTHSGSSNVLFAIYARYLRRQSGGALTPAGYLKRQVTWLAWYKLCPFQRWAHTPVGSHD